MGSSWPSTQGLLRRNGHRKRRTANLNVHGRHTDVRRGPSLNSLGRVRLVILVGEWTVVARDGDLLEGFGSCEGRPLCVARATVEVALVPLVVEHPLVCVFAGAGGDAASSHDVAWDNRFDAQF